MTLPKRVLLEFNLFLFLFLFWEHISGGRQGAFRRGAQGTAAQEFGSDVGDGTAKTGPGGGQVLALLLPAVVRSAQLHLLDCLLGHQLRVDDSKLKFRG